MKIEANTPVDVLAFITKHFREQASMYRRSASMKRLVTDQRSDERLSKSLDLIAQQLEQSFIVPRITNGK